MVNDTHHGVLPVDDKCGLDPSRVLEVVSDELIGRTTEEDQPLIKKALAWRNTSANFRTALSLLDPADSGRRQPPYGPRTSHVSQ